MLFTVMVFSPSGGGLAHPFGAMYPSLEYTGLATRLGKVFTLAEDVKELS